MTARALLSIVLLASCGDSTSSTSEAPPGRVVAVTSSTTEATAEDFCEQSFDGTAFDYPTLEGGAQGPSSGLRWINIWATWCAPCIEELPRLSTFEAELAEEGLTTDLVLLNADQDAEAYERFVAEHPEVAGTLRMAEPDKLAEWTEALGVLGSPTLPVHLLVNDEGELTCFRASGIRDDEYPALKAALSN